MINAWLFAILFSCVNVDQECLLIDDFVDTWWVVTDPTGMDEVCYLFSSDGKLVTKDDKGNNSISGDWFTQDVDCLKSITSDDISITILGTTGDCILAKYEGYNLTVCECQSK